MVTVESASRLQRRQPTARFSSSSQPKLYVRSAGHTRHRYILIRMVKSFLVLLRSALPFLLFLAAYGANARLRILPTAEDSADFGGRVQLNDVWSWERAMLWFMPVTRPLHKVVSGTLQNPLFDFMAAVPYLAHYSLPVLCPLFFIVVYRRLDLACRFYLLLGVTMWTFYTVWFFLPTAPPWYYDRTVVPDSEADMSTLDGRPDEHPEPADGKSTMCREGAAFARLDRLLGVAFFRRMFAGNPVPYGAFPSGHVAWPTCFVVALLDPPVDPGRRLVQLAIGVGYVMVVSWATLYTSHHYAADVVASVSVVLIVNVVLNCLRFSSARSQSSSSDVASAVACRDEEDVEKMAVECDAVSVSHFSPISKGVSSNQTSGIIFRSIV